MAGLSRRTFLQGGIGAAAGAAALAGPFQGFLARAGRRAAAARRAAPDDIRDLRGDVVRLWLPAGFQYRSFHDTEETVDADRRHHAARPPRRHGRVPGAERQRDPGPQPRGQRPGAGLRARARRTTPMTGGGTTTIEVDLFGNVVSAYTSLNGTQMNCAGGRMPWGSWITCEETVNGPDVGPDFTGASNVTLHEAPRVPLRGARRRPVEPRADHAGPAGSPTRRWPSTRRRASST